MQGSELSDNMINGSGDVEIINENSSQVYIMENNITETENEIKATSPFPHS